MGKKSKKNVSNADRKQQLEQRRQRQTGLPQQGAGEVINVGDRVRYWDGDQTDWIRGIVQNMGKVTDISNPDDPMDVHPEPGKYIAKTVYKIVPDGAAESEVVTVLDTGKNIFRDV